MLKINKNYYNATNKSKAIAVWLWFVGFCGIINPHNFYLKKIKTGIVKTALLIAFIVCVSVVPYTNEFGYDDVSSYLHIGMFLLGAILIGWSLAEFIYILIARKSEDNVDKPTIKIKSKVIIFALIPVLCVAVAAGLFKIYTAPHKVYVAWKDYEDCSDFAKEIYKRDADAVFEIKRYVTENEYEYGTGFFIDPSGICMTAAHVVEHFDDANRTYITLNNGKVLNITEILFSDKDDDMAIFQVDNPSGQVFPYLELADDYDIGDEIIIIGAKTHKYSYLSEGKILNIVIGYIPDENGNMTYSGFKEASDAILFEGNSGGPVLNKDNQVIGVAHAELTPAGNGANSLFAPITDYTSAIKSILN